MQTGMSDDASKDEVLISNRTPYRFQHIEREYLIFTTPNIIQQQLAYDVLFVEMLFLYTLVQKWQTQGQESMKETLSKFNQRNLNTAKDGGANFR